eukprot:COSAG01_NODE_4091_length_5357_cov_9.914036_6_plen_160_part_00
MSGWVCMSVMQSASSPRSTRQCSAPAPRPTHTRSRTVRGARRGGRSSTCAVIRVTLGNPVDFLHHLFDGARATCAPAHTATESERAAAAPRPAWGKTRSAPRCIPPHIIPVTLSSSSSVAISEPIQVHRRSYRRPYGTLVRLVRRRSLGLGMRSSGAAI